jgi:VanZ family protein
MFLRYNLPGIIWAFFILMLIGLPGKDVPDMSFWSLLTPDKIFHSGIFLVLVLLLVVGFTKQHKFSFLYYHAKSIALITGLAYGGITELLQMFVFTERTADIMDFMANAIGCFLGIIVFRLVFGKQ